MTRIKNKHGLTPQQELFCQYVVDAYGSDTKGILVAAYRKAYNCKSDAKAGTHYTSASLLMNDPKITQRIEQLQQQREQEATITRERIVSDDVKILDIDPLDLWIEDPELQCWRLRYINEIPKHIRKLIKFVRVGKRLIPDVDKDAARKRLIDVLGFASAKDINVNTGFTLGNEIRIGFDN